MLRVWKTERGREFGLRIVDAVLRLDKQELRLAEIHLREIGIESRLELVPRQD